MIADAVESASRTLSEPTPKRIETLVHDITMKRLLDGQFDECSLTLSEIHAVEESLMKSLIGIYHGRIKYPGTAHRLMPREPCGDDCRPSPRFCPPPCTTSRSPTIKAVWMLMKSFCGRFAGTLRLEGVRAQVSIALVDDAALRHSIGNSSTTITTPTC